MNSISFQLKEYLEQQGADLVAFGDITELPPDQCDGLPIGISVAVRYPKEVIRGISELPTQEYYDWYKRLNMRLDAIVTVGAEWLQTRGYRALARTRATVGKSQTEFGTTLPHKTVATRAGLGWIGKCALLVTPQYGSMVRLSSILTDAPLKLTAPINVSRCGACTACADACPARAVSGALWHVGVQREALYDPVRCSAAARLRAKSSFGIEYTICGKCIEICPYTRKFLES
jgi:epoxyqueuosine reductase QueG